MPDMNDMIETLNQYEHGNLTWNEAFKELLKQGLVDYIIKEALGNEPEEI